MKSPRIINQDIPLQKSEIKFRSLADNLPVAVIRYDTGHRRTYINPAAKHMLQGDTDEMLGFVPGGGGVPATASMIAFYRSKMAEVLETGEIREFDFSMDALPLGQQSHYEVRMAPEYGEDGKIVGALTTWFDITERKRMEEELRLKELVLDQAQEGVYLINERARFVYVNDEACRMLGYSREELLGMGVGDIDYAKSDEESLAVREQTLQTGSFAFETKHRRRDGSLLPVEIQASTVIYRGKYLGLALARDITERKRAERALEARAQEFHSLAESSADFIVRYDIEHRIRYLNNNLVKFFGLTSASEIIGRRPCEVWPDGRFREIEVALDQVMDVRELVTKEIAVFTSSGEAQHHHIQIVPEFGADGNLIGTILYGRDVSELDRSRQKIHQMAFYDTLTSLPNRALFYDRLRQMITDASWHHQVAGVMMIDMDRFKEVNDTMGHAVGDELLRITATRLSACVRAYDTVARLGGDEFAVLLPEVRQADDLGRIADNIRSVFDAPFILEGKEVFVSCSIGIALYPNDSTDADDLLKYADSAMYYAKRSGRNNFRFYSRDLTESANERLVLESDLRRVTERSELELYYQPKVSLHDGYMIGSEALLRWKHPQRGMIPPDKFIPVAEDSGLILEIGEWVLREACRTACDFNGQGKPLHKVAINLSARQFQANDLVATVYGALQATGCHPEWIELEITESLLLDEDGVVLDMLKAFRALGITIAIDDFGTGYSALSYLARFPINTIKIDRSFVYSIEIDTFRAELVKAILSIARCLGQEVVAEGVETRGQAGFLQTHGCQTAQGYLFSKPVSEAEFINLPHRFEV